MPCSELISAASSPWRERMSSRNANSTLARLVSDVSAQAGQAPAAASTAAPASAAEAKSTVPVTSPVAGL